MIAIWMLYVSALSLCFGLAALALERAARLWARPRRFVWAAAIAASLLAPLAGLMLPGSVPQRAAPGSVLRQGPVFRPVPTERAPSVGVSSAPRKIGPLVAALNRPLLLLWGGASLVLALGLLRASVGLRRRARGWRATVVDGTEVLVAPDIGPAVVRLGGLKVVLPNWALSVEPAACALMLRHENEHRRARDPDLVLGATVALMLVPWAIPLWWLVRRLQLAVETDCDRRVMRGGADGHAYGVLLVSVGARSALQPHLAPTAFSEERSILERRIEAMRPPSSKRRLLRTALAAGVGALSVAAACMAPHPAPAPAPKPAAAPTQEPPRAPAQQRERVYAEDSVTDRPVLLSHPRLTYPDSLRTAGIGGRVLVEAIVDTTGHADSASVRILSSSNPEFDAPAREGVLAARYRPGRIDGRPVMVRVRIPLSFQVTRFGPDSAYRPTASDSFLRDGVQALRAQDYGRADSLLGLAQQQATGQALQTATFYHGVAQFQRGYAALMDAQLRQRNARNDPAARAAACASAAAAASFLSQAEPNITGGAASNRDLANQLLSYLPQMKNALPPLARGLNCPT
jgi:TonB family protein